MNFIDTHSHLDGEEFQTDLSEVIERARTAGIGKIFVPAIDYPSSHRSLQLSKLYEGFLYPMFGLHPEEVKKDWHEQLQKIKERYFLSQSEENIVIQSQNNSHYIAIGEVGLDYYWSREYEHEQLEAFEEQVQWSVEMRLPMMIHCRKAQNEMVNLLKKYKDELPGGVFHCFTGNEKEAAELLQFERFVLGIGGVLTFKKSHLPEVLPASVPLERIVLETDSPYMAPVPYRGKRNESAFVVEVARKLAECYHVTMEQISTVTTNNVLRIFPAIQQG